jgi:KDO2-lipid IV(A) lauroyltransferase
VLLIGKCLGRLLYVIGGERRLFTERNLELCFPEKNVAERQRLTRQVFESAGMAFLETGMAWWWPDWRLKRICRIEGLEHIDNLQGKGAILLGMHFTHLDMGVAALALHHHWGAMYRGHKNPVFNLLQYRGRQRGRDLELFPRKDIRTMVKLLREGKLVWYAADQDYGAEYSVFAPFFGIQAATITATAKLAAMGKAQVLPFTHERLPGIQGYRITIAPPLENFPAGDDVEDATRINQLVEEKVRQNPAQYLWAHRRFKSRPPGEESLYPRKKSRLKREARRAERKAKAKEKGARPTKKN